MSKARKSRIQDGDEVRAANYERLCVLFNTFFGTVFCSTLSSIKLIFYLLSFLVQCKLRCSI